MEPTEKPILYGYWRSSASWRVRIALNIKGIEYEGISINLVEGTQRSEEHKERNPAGFVPALVIDGHTLYESLPIIEYLEETWPDLPSLYPKDAYDKWQARALAETINAGIQPIQNLSILGKVEKELGGDKVKWGNEIITKGLTAFEKQVEKSMGLFCVGNQVTIADLCLIPQMYNCGRFKVDMEQFPNINKIVANLKELDAFKEADANNQPDAS